MGKNDKMKKYILIPSFDLHSPNRGNAALAYGTIAFLKEHQWIEDGQEVYRLRVYKNPFKNGNSKFKTEINIISGKAWTDHIVPVHYIIAKLYKKTGILLPFTKFRKFVRNTSLIAADFGGDGFSDIYGQNLFDGRFSQIDPLINSEIPFIILPQTIGPFKKKENLSYALRILRRATKIFVRDENYVKELQNYKLEFEKTKDLSAYMNPEQWDIEIMPNSIGINVSGLAYSNNFRSLSGQFETYPLLINKLIEHYRAKGHHIYLIPHSYRYNSPDTNNDDLEACKQAYERLIDKSNVTVIDNNLTSPQVKYVISKMMFFIGTRMHANFAAIYTNVPLFGLAYSYKFKGAFDANNLDGESQTAYITNLKENEIDDVIKKIDFVYSKKVVEKSQKDNFPYEEES